jgi:hypothetical protein
MPRPSEHKIGTIGLLLAVLGLTSGRAVTQRSPAHITAIGGRLMQGKPNGWMRLAGGRGQRMLLHYGQCDGFQRLGCH